jgi:6-phosphogluconate dehydrogenase
LSVEVLKEALFSSFVLSYAQGFSLLTAASVEKNYELDLKEITRIWRGGCIIRAALLEDFRKVFARDANLANILFDENVAALIKPRIESLRSVVAFSAAEGFASYCLMSCLAYFDAFTSARLPANLIQAQRDFFGAHTYQRTDQEGTFHTGDWEAAEARTK